jgi:hypothetical protein
MVVFVTTASELIDHYFELAPGADTAPYFAQFADHATVEDEGQTHRGLEAITVWRAAVPRVTYTVLDVRSTGDEHVARAEIAGEFPGSPVVLTFHFTFTGEGKIETLAIR